MAILYGTQSNGETLPVLVDQFGNLLAKGIDGEPGQPGANGETGPQGPPGPDGEGVPTPYGEEGNYLRIKDGAPSWEAGETPTPPGPMGPVIWTNISNSGRLMDSSGNAISPEDPYEYVTGLSSWGDNENFDKAGSSPFPITNPTGGGGDLQPAMNFEFEDMLGKVLTLLFCMDYRNSREAQQRITRECSFDDPQISLIAIDGPVYMENASSGVSYASWSVSYLFNREVTAASHSHHFYNSDMTSETLHFRGWDVIEAGTFAVNQQIEVKEQLRQMKLVMSADIDLSRPT